MARVRRAAPRCRWAVARGKRAPRGAGALARLRTTAKAAPRIRRYPKWRELHSQLRLVSLPGRGALPVSSESKTSGRFKLWARARAAWTRGGIARRLVRRRLEREDGETERERHGEAEEGRRRGAPGSHPRPRAIAPFWLRVFKSPTHPLLTCAPVSVPPDHQAVFVPAYQRHHRGVDGVLQNQDYAHPLVGQWTNDVVAQCVEQLPRWEPFKYVVTCVIMQRTGAGLHTASSCYWDTETDGSRTVRWENKTMYCIVSVFGLAI